MCKKKHEEEMMPLLLTIRDIVFLYIEISQICQLNNEVGLSGVTIERKFEHYLTFNYLAALANRHN